MNPQKQTREERADTGIPGLDDILAGGFPRSRIYLVQGDPGVGKTTLGLQFLLAGAARGETVMYVTLSESKQEIQAVAESHGWSLDKVVLFELSAFEQSLRTESDNTVFHPAEVELREITKTLLEAVAKVNPRRVVFDSLSEVRLLAQSAIQYRRQILQLKHYFTGRETTVLLLDDRTNPDGDTQLQSLAHGVVALEQLPQGYGAERRRLRIIKLRGLKFRGGYHDYKLETGGVTIFPRLVAAEHPAATSGKSLPSGIEALDKLNGGGLDPGTSTLIIGPAGAGKSSLMIHYACEAAKQGLRCALYLFDEGRATLYLRAKALGLDLARHIESGQITVRQVDPAELAPDELAHQIRKAVEVEGRTFVAIDSLNGYLHAMPDERFLTVQLHELLSYLAHKGVFTVMVMAQHGMLGAVMASPVDLSYVADSVMLLRFFEAAGRIRKSISVLKKRSGRHEDTIRELFMDPEGISLGPPLVNFQGVLTGVPTFMGDAAQAHNNDRQRE